MPEGSGKDKELSLSHTYTLSLIPPFTGAEDAAAGKAQGEANGEGHHEGHLLKVVEGEVRVEGAHHKPHEELKANLAERAQRRKRGLRLDEGRFFYVSRTS